MSNLAFVRPRETGESTSGFSGVVHSLRASWRRCCLEWLWWQIWFQQLRGLERGQRGFLRKAMRQKKAECAWGISGNVENIPNFEVLLEWLLCGWTDFYFCTSLNTLNSLKGAWMTFICQKVIIFKISIKSKVRKREFLWSWRERKENYENSGTGGSRERSWCPAGASARALMTFGDRSLPVLCLEPPELYPLDVSPPPPSTPGTTKNVSRNLLNVP